MHPSIAVNLKSSCTLQSPTPITCAVFVWHASILQLDVKRISPSGIFNSTFILRVLIASTITIG